MLIRDLRAEREHLAVEILPLDRMAYERAQRIALERLRDVVVRAVLHRLHDRFDFVDRRRHDDVDLGVVLLDDLEQLEPADAGQADVDEHQVDGLGLQQRERLLGAGCRQRAVVRPEDRGERSAG